MKTILHFFATLTLSLNLLNAQEWFKYADLPVNVIPKDITVNNSGTLFMLTSDNSIYFKHTNDSWQKMTSQALNPNCISVDESSNKLYVGTLNQGIMHTSNFGNSWGMTFLFTNPHTGMHESYNLISNIKNPNLFFATNIGSNQLVKFTNQGSNGQSITVNPDTGFNVYDLHYTANNKLLVGSNQGVWISNNNGNNYSASGLNGISTFSFTEDENGNVYLLSLNNSGQNKLWVSGSAEYNIWTELALPASPNAFQMVYFDKSSSTIWLADENSIYKSPVATINWTEENQNQDNPTVVEFIDDNNGNLFSFTTENNCQEYSANAWVSANDGLSGEIHQILLDENNKLFAYNNYYSNKLASMENLNTNWNYKIIGTNGLNNLIKYDVNTILLNQWNKVYKSIDNGHFFSEINLPDELEDQTGGGIGLFQKGDLNDLFLTHTFIQNKVFNSSNLGETWTTIDLNDQVNQIIQDENGNLLAILFGSNTGFIPEIQYSVNNGASWNILENDLINFSSSNVILFTKNNRNFCQIDGGIYEITLPDEILTEISIPVTVPNNHDLQFNLNNSNEMFIIDSDYNLHKSVDNGNTWQNFGKPAGVPNGYITSLQFGFEETPFVIYKAYNSASTLQGIYYFGEEILSTTEPPASSEFSIYPNPAQGELYIRTSYRGNFYLFDVLGKLILKEFINQDITKLNTRSLPKGIYFIKLENGQSYKVLKQ